MNTTISLDSVTAECIKSITNSGVYSRGLSYYKNDHVRNLKYDDGELTAEVAGSEPIPYNVFILSDGKEIYDMNCSCFYASDGEICKHIVATLLQWIERRNKRMSYKPSIPQQKTSFDPDDFFERTFPCPSFGHNSAHILQDIFSDAGDFSLKADILN